VSDKDYIHQDAHAAAIQRERAAAQKDGVAQGIEQGVTKGAAQERARIKAILTAPAAEKRQKSAQTLAFDTEMLPEAAAAILAGLPEEGPRRTIPSLAERHAAAGTGAGAEGPGGAEAAARSASSGGRGGVMQQAAAKIARRRAGSESETDGVDGSV